MFYIFGSKCRGMLVSGVSDWLQCATSLLDDAVNASQCGLMYLGISHVIGWLAWNKLLALFTSTITV